jgi:long-chain fatty acid transport protein
MNPHHARLACYGLLSALLTTSAHAGGFALIEHGASGLGNAYAGAAAVSADSSTVWFNPAGMTEIQGKELSGTLHVLASSTDWTDQGTSLGSAVGGGEVSGPDTASPGTTTLLPNVYFVAPVNKQWSYGLSIGVPFGSSTEYDSDWKGRYTTVESGISVLDINPALSYQVSDKVRLGFGISVQQLTADLGNSVDSGVVCLGLASTDPSSPLDVSFTQADCVNNGLTPGNLENDSTAEIEGDSVAVGFNLGALFLPSDDIKIGIAYRHSVDHELDGDADFTVNAGLRALLDGNTVAATQPATQALLTDTGASAEVELPAMLSLSGAWQASDKVQLLSDITWTGWSSFEELRIQFDNPAQSDSFQNQAWEDVLRFSLGLNYRHSPKLVLRAGYAFDEEAIPSAQRRTARIPGNDRTWFTLGFGYNFNQNLSLDMGYASLFLDDTPIDNPNDELEGSGTFVRGIYEPRVDILSAQLSWGFN